MKQDPHEMAYEALVPAFRSAMHSLDTHLRKEGMETDLFSLYSRVSDLAQTLVHQFENALYEERNLRLELEKQQLANQRLQTQFEYREKRESILEQAYVETQLALKSSEILLKRSEQDKHDIQKHARYLEKSHTSVVIEHGELKGENEQLKIGIASAERFLEEERRLGKLTSDELDDVKGALQETREDRNRLRMLARNRRHGLHDACNVFAYMKAEGMLITDDLKWNGHTFDGFLDHLAALARPVDYRTGEPLTDRMATAQQLNDEGAILPLHIGVDLAAGPVHTVVVDGMFVDAEPVEVAEKLGYSKRAHDFPPGENMKDVACLRCGIGWLECVDDNHFCNAEEADENGVHLGAQIATVAEAIQNGESQH